MKRKVLLPNGTFTTAGPKDYIIRPNPDGSVTQANGSGQPTQDIAKKAVILEPNLLIGAQNSGVIWLKQTPMPQVECLSMASKKLITNTMYGVGYGVSNWTIALIPCHRVIATR